MLLIVYYIVILLYIACFLSHLLKQKRIGFFISLLAVMSNGILLTLIFFQTGHIPAFNLFESFLFVAFIIGALGLVPISPKDYSNEIRLWIGIETLVLLCITLFFPKEPAFTLYDYDYIYNYPVPFMPQYSAGANALFNSLFCPIHNTKRTG